MDNTTTNPVMNPTFIITEVEATDTQARLVIEPLENGYGHTIGNALRRVLLTSLRGAAITSVIIEGVDHQYSTMEGLSEDIIEFVLNTKLVRVKSETTDENASGTLRLNVKGPKEVTAADIECEGGFSIANPDQVIATLSKGANLIVEMAVESGMGYQIGNDQQSDVIGQIMIDALFSPIIKVSYKVEATRVGRKTDYDRIVFDVQTDGTITPLNALEKAAEILSKQFTQVFDPVIPEVEEDVVTLSPEEAEVLRLTVEELDLPTRIANALRKGGYATVGDLITTEKTVISKVKNLGGKSVDLINDALKKKGVSLED